MKIPRLAWLAQAAALGGLGLVVVQVLGLWSPPAFVQTDQASTLWGLAIAAGFVLLAIFGSILPSQGTEPDSGAGLFSATHLGAGIVGLGCLLWSQKLAFSPGAGLLATLSLAPLVGLALTHRFRRDLRLAQEALARFVRGAALPDLPARPHPALRPSYDALRALTAQGGDLPEIRETWLQKVGEAAAQEERNRLARDLHDSIKQQLFGIHLSAATVRQRWQTDPQGAMQVLDQIRRSAKEALVEMQAMLRQLQPQAVAATGLAEALREQAEALGYRSGANVLFESSEPIPDDRMPPKAPEALFRIGQEALANVARHARAKHVHVELERHDESIVLTIEDDGQGFDPGKAKEGMGLRNLRERVAALQGNLAVDSRPGAGTRIRVEAPLLPPPPPPELLQTLEQEVQKAERNARGFLFFPFAQLAQIASPGHIWTPRATLILWLVWGGMALYTWIVSWVRTRSIRELPTLLPALHRARFSRAIHAQRALFWCCSLYFGFAAQASLDTAQGAGIVLFTLVCGYAAWWELTRFYDWSVPGKVDLRAVGHAALGIAAAIFFGFIGSADPLHRGVLPRLVLAAGALFLAGLFAVRSGARTPPAAKAAD